MHLILAIRDKLRREKRVFVFPFWAACGRGELGVLVDGSTDLYFESSFEWSSGVLGQFRELIVIYELLFAVRKYSYNSYNSLWE